MPGVVAPRGPGQWPGPPTRKALGDCGLALPQLCRSLSRPPWALVLARTSNQAPGRVLTPETLTGPHRASAQAPRNWPTGAQPRPDGPAPRSRCPIPSHCPATKPGTRGGAGLSSVRFLVCSVTGLLQGLGSLWAWTRPRLASGDVSGCLQLGRLICTNLHLFTTHTEMARH